MSIVYAVRADSPQAPPLARLIDLPLGLDIWQVKTDHVVLRAAEEQATRLRQMGYTTEEVVETERHLAAFATAEAIAAYHSAETLESHLHQLAESQPEIAELQEIGRSLEDRPIWALRIGERRASEHKLLFMGCHHAREWVSVEVPYLLAEHLVNNANQPPVRQWLQRGEIWVARWSIQMDTNFRATKTDCGARIAVPISMAASAWTRTETTVTCGGR